MDTKVIIVGTSLLVAGALQISGGTLEAFTMPLPVVGVNALQIGGAVVAMVGIGTLVGFDPLRLKQAAASTAF